jgi:hypothetical protein
VSDIFDDTVDENEEGAPEVRESPGVVEFRSKRKGGPGAPAGNEYAVKHGTYCSQWTEEEIRQRAEYECGLLDDLGAPSTGQRSLIRRAGFLEMTNRRVEKASMAGIEIPASEHVIAWINAQRHILQALGLKPRQKKAPTPWQYLEQREKQQAEEPEGAE